jgi:ribosomal 30S subunit maturation factor RimM
VYEFYRLSEGRINKMEIEYGLLVEDKDGKALGTVSQVIEDSWTGEPRKFVVRLEEKTGAIYFSPQQVAEVTKEKVKLNLAVEELDQT